MDITNTTRTDRAINALPNGGRIILGQSNGFTVAAERSGNGRTIRIVRESRNGFIVISETSR